MVSSPVHESVHEETALGTASPGPPSCHIVDCLLLKEGGEIDVEAMAAVSNADGGPCA